MMALRRANIVGFLRDTRQELRGVQWPTRAMTIRFTLLIVGVSAAVAVGTGLLDFGLAALAERFLLR